jgi:biliverdin reductase/flavin reductase
MASIIDLGAQMNVYDAMEEVGIRRAMVVGSIGIWKEGTDWPEWYDQAASEFFSAREGELADGDRE